MMPLIHLILVGIAPEPVRIFNGQPPAAPLAADPNYFAWLSAICFVAALALSYWIWRRAQQRPSEIRAFERLARVLGISRSERNLLHRMSAIEGQVSPLAMLVSPSAFVRGRKSMESQLIGTDQALLRNLAVKLMN